MSVEDNLRVIDEIEKAVNARDWTRFDELHAESIVEYSPQKPEPSKGIDAHRESMQGLITAFPDMRAENVRAFGQGDWVCTEISFTGTHKGPLAGPGGQTIPATNKPVRMTLCGVAKIEGGRITEEHNYFDLLGMMAQLGLAPEGD